MWDPKYQPLEPGTTLDAAGVEIRNGVAVAPDVLGADDVLVDLVRDVRVAAGKMSRKNPHRHVLARCEDALIQLAVRVGELSKEKAHAPTPSEPVGRIVITG